MSEKLPYNRAQWEWINQKKIEGYTINALSKFLGVSRETVRRHLLEINNPPCKEDMMLLDKNEFNKLGDNKEKN